MEQLGLFDQVIAEPVKRSKQQVKHHRRLFWTAMKHPQQPTIGFNLRANYRIHYCIPGWYNRSYDCPDYQDWMYTRRLRLRRLFQGYEDRQLSESRIAMTFLKDGDTESAKPFEVKAAAYKAKADYYYSQYQEHTYHTL